MKHVEAGKDLITQMKRIRTKIIEKYGIHAFVILIRLEAVKNPDEYLRALQKF